MTKISNMDTYQMVFLIEPESSGANLEYKKRVQMHPL